MEFIQIIEFRTSKLAEVNSALPETDAFSRKMMTLAEGPPTFYNLDVIDDRE